MSEDNILLKERRRKKKNTKSRLFTSHGVYVNCAFIVMLCTHLIGNQPYNMMVVFKMLDSVPSMRYSSIRNVLHLWSIWLIPTNVTL